LLLIFLYIVNDFSDYFSLPEGQLQSTGILLLARSYQSWLY